VRHRNERENRIGDGDRRDVASIDRQSIFISLANNTYTHARALSFSLCVSPSLLPCNDAGIISRLATPVRRKSSVFLTKKKKREKKRKKKEERKRENGKAITLSRAAIASEETDLMEIRDRFQQLSTVRKRT